MVEKESEKEMESRERLRSVCPCDTETDQDDKAPGTLCPLPLLSFAFCGRHGLLYNTAAEKESRVVLMGQMCSDEDKRGLYSFPSKAGNGKSVPRRNHVLPGIEGLCRVGWSCQALIRDSYSHLRMQLQQKSRVSQSLGSTVHKTILYPPPPPQTRPLSTAVGRMSNKKERATCQR
ncbi:hypothetical protein PAMP_007443 [Pampus punctatissimus]